MAIIKRVDLADLQGTIPVVDAQGLPTPMFLRFLNTTVRALKTGINNLIDVQNAVQAANDAAALATAAAATAATATQAVAKDQALVNSYITPSSVLTASVSTITIANHVRHYADGSSVAVIGGTVPATGSGNVDYISYSDPAHTGGNVTYAVSTTAPAQTNDVHVVGAVTIPTTGTVAGGSGPRRPGEVLP
jgi:hypothetical protein